MKKNILKAGMLIMAVLFISSCSNLDESAFNINPDNGSDIILSETFELGLGNFIQFSESGDETWAYNSSGYAIITGYVGGVNKANVDWLISPEIDLTSTDKAKLTFDHVPRYFADVTNEATVWVSENYTKNSNPADAVWTQLKTNPFSDPGNWNFLSSGEISLTAYAGKKISIAFKYISTNTKAGTWEIKNFLVKKGEAVVDAELIYLEPFAANLGRFSQVSVTGDEVWYVTNGYAYMTGYVSSTNKANEDWLISPEIDLTNHTAANFSFDHVTRYFGALATEATVWLSTNYTEGLPSTATWTQIQTSPFFDPGSWTFSNSKKISLTPWAGQKVRIAFKYISTATKAGSWEIKNFQVYSGEANGTEKFPYTVSEAITAQNGGTGWVEGYVVGYAWPFMQQWAYFYSADTCSQITNVILADSTNNIYSSKSVALQLPRGSIRSQLNLMTNKTQLKKKIKINGTLSSNAGIAGIINPTEYVLSDGTKGTSSTLTLFYEPFSGPALGAFTTNNVTGAQIWYYSSGYGATMTGFASSVNNANEDWLISPEIDLTTQTGAALTFDQTINKGVVANMKTEQTLWISINNGTSWVQLNIPTYPAGNNWTFVNSGEISLDAYAGKKVKLAFKYLSTTSSSATWEIKNFKVYN